MAEGKRIGKITHYYDKIGVAVVEVESPFGVGDFIEIRDKNGETRFGQEVSSLQIEHVNVQKVTEGQLVGLKVEQRVKRGDLVFKL